MRAASRQLVWSFQSQHCALRLRFHLACIARGTFLRSTGIGLDPVVSTPIPDLAGGKSAGPFRSRERAPDAFREGCEIIAWILAREMGVAGIEEDALSAALVVGDAGAQLRAILAADDERASRVRSKINSEGEGHRGETRVEGCPLELGMRSCIDWMVK